MSYIQFKCSQFTINNVHDSMIYDNVRTLIDSNLSGRVLSCSLDEFKTFSRRHLVTKHYMCLVFFVVSHRFGCKNESIILNPLPIAAHYYKNT